MAYHPVTLILWAVTGVPHKNKLRLQSGTFCIQLSIKPQVKNHNFSIHHFLLVAMSTTT